MIRKLLSRFAKGVDDPETRLGAILLMLCVCSPEELEAAERAKKPGQRLGDVLIEQRAISADDLKAALRLQRHLRNGKRAEAMIEIAHRQLDHGVALV